MAALYERYTAVPVGAVTLIDEFARRRATRGPFPPLAGPVRFKLVATIAGDATETPLDPPLYLRTELSPSGVYLFTGEARAERGPALQLREGRFRLRVESDFYQPAELELAFPVEAGQPVQTLTLLPGPAYPFPDLSAGQSTLTLLYGSLFEPGGGTRPVEGARVTVTDPSEQGWPFDSCVTGANGGWVLPLPSAVGVPVVVHTLRFALPDGETFDVPDVQVRPGAENSLQQTSLRGRVLDLSGSPLRGARVTVSELPDEEAAASADGQWSFYLSLLQPDAAAVVTARSPSGGEQAQEVQIRNRATVFVPAFRIATN